MNKDEITLESVAEYLEEKIREKGFDVKYVVKEVYSDYGLGLIHKTIVASDSKGNHSFQIFYTPQIEAINSGEFTKEHSDEIVAKHQKYFENWGVALIN